MSLNIFCSIFILYQVFLVLCMAFWNLVILMKCRCSHSFLVILICILHVWGHFSLCAILKCCSCCFYNVTCKYTSWYKVSPCWVCWHVDHKLFLNINCLSSMDNVFRILFYEDFNLATDPNLLKYTKEILKNTNEK